MRIAAKNNQIMKLSELKSSLQNVESINLVKPDGTLIPRHFHITEIGLTTKKFIDCGNKNHISKKANLQVWVNLDRHHRLKPAKLTKIIDSSAELFEGEDLEVEIEYQTDTVGIYGLEFNNSEFQLTPTETACLAADACGIPAAVVQAGAKIEKKLEEVGCCTPGGACC